MLGFETYQFALKQGQFLQEPIGRPVKVFLIEFFERSKVGAKNSVS